MDYEIVVARYNENIEWLHSERDHCIIYNKGNLLNISNEILLPNIGRESHTYLYHIINNYHKLADITIFTQARLSDHRFGSDDVLHLIKMKLEAEMYGKSLPLDISCWDENTKHCATPRWNVDENGFFYLHNNYLNDQRKTCAEWFVEFTKEKEYANPLKWYGNGIFAISKEVILKNPKSYYELLIKQVDHNINPAEGHFFERSWYYIFE
jgi:hypothetical protein